MTQAAPVGSCHDLTTLSEPQELMARCGRAKGKSKVPTRTTSAQTVPVPLASNAGMVLLCVQFVEYRADPLKNCRKMPKDGGVLACETRVCNGRELNHVPLTFTLSGQTVEVPTSIFKHMMDKMIRKHVRPLTKKHRGTKLREAKPTMTVESLWHQELSTEHGLPWEESRALNYLLDFPVLLI